MNKKVSAIICIGICMILCSIILLFRTNVFFENDSTNFWEEEYLGTTETLSKNYETESSPLNRVIGLLSDNNGGSIVVSYNTETWDYQVIMYLPEVTPDNYVALSNDNNKLAYTIWSENYTIRYLNIVDMTTGNITTFFDDMPVRNEIIKISWMPDNNSLLYIRNDTSLQSLQSIEYINTTTAEITVVDCGEVWKIRQIGAQNEKIDPFTLPGSNKKLTIKYSKIANNLNEYWYYYLDNDDLNDIYVSYGGTRDFDFNTIINYMYVVFSAPRCSEDGETIIYSATLERNSAPGSHTPLWVTSAIWSYDVETQDTHIIYKQADEAAIGRVDWCSGHELCFVTYYDYQGSRDNVNYFNTQTERTEILFHYSDEYYNNVTLLPVGNRKITFTSSSKDSFYSDSSTYIMDIQTKEYHKLDIEYNGEVVILENFIYY